MPTPQNVHVDAPLRNLSIQYRKTDYIADMCLPPVLVNKLSDKFFTYNKHDRFTVPDLLRAPKGEAREVDWGAGTSNYSCKEYAAKELVSAHEKLNADAPLSPRADAAEFLQDLQLLAREKGVAALLPGPGVVSL